MELNNQDNSKKPKLSHQEKAKIWAEIDKQKKLNKLKKIELNKKVKEEHLNQVKERKDLLNAYHSDLTSKWNAYKQQIEAKSIDKKTANAEFKQYKLQRLQKYHEDDQTILNMTSEALRKRPAFIIRRWFFGLGKEFSRITWTTSRQVLKDFLIIIIIVAILACIFLLLDFILQQSGVLPK